MAWRCSLFPWLVAKAKVHNRSKDRNDCGVLGPKWKIIPYTNTYQPKVWEHHGNVGRKDVRGKPEVWRQQSQHSNELAAPVANAEDLHKTGPFILMGKREGLLRLRPSLRDYGQLMVSGKTMGTH